MLSYSSKLGGSFLVALRGNKLVHLELPYAGLPQVTGLAPNPWGDCLVSGQLSATLHLKAQAITLPGLTRADDVVWISKDLFVSKSGRDVLISRISGR